MVKQAAARVSPQSSFPEIGEIDQKEINAYIASKRRLGFHSLFEKDPVVEGAFNEIRIGQKKLERLKISTIYTLLNNLGKPGKRFKIVERGRDGTQNPCVLIYHIEEKKYQVLRINQLSSISNRLQAVVKRDPLQRKARSPIANSINEFVDLGRALELFLKGTVYSDRELYQKLHSFFSYASDPNTDDFRGFAPDTALRSMEREVLEMALGVKERFEPEDGKGKGKPAALPFPTTGGTVTTAEKLEMTIKTLQKEKHTIDTVRRERAGAIKGLEGVVSSGTLPESTEEGVKSIETIQAGRLADIEKAKKKMAEVDKKIAAINKRLVGLKRYDGFLDRILNFITRDGFVIEDFIDIQVERNKPLSSLKTKIRSRKRIDQPSGVIEGGENVEMNLETTTRFTVDGHAMTLKVEEFPEGEARCVYCDLDECSKVTVDDSNVPIERGIYQLRKRDNKLILQSMEWETGYRFSSPPPVALVRVLPGAPARIRMKSMYRNKTIEFTAV
ncbi:MAG: hypothetical protein HQL54_11935 [Magnetococcales bacterium]|nr:hypothetical protein [Magnetococcales bacterium]